MNSLKAFIYFVEPEVIEEALPSWPNNMRLALCLYQTGQCEIVVYHHNEGHQIIARMQGILGLRTGSFGVVPQINGYPTKAIRFSDQQHFVRLILEKDDLCEIAADYAINYQFAEEEGLDPVCFTDRAYMGEKVKNTKKSQDAAFEKPFETRRLKPKIPIQIKKKPRSNLGDAFPQKTKFRGNFAEIARIEKFDEHVLLTLNPDAAPDNASILRATGIIHIDEHNQFLLERPLLQKWKAGQSATIEMPLEQLFCKFTPHYFDKPRIAVVMIVPNDIFVTCGPEIPSNDTPIDTTHAPNYPFPQKDIHGMNLADSQKWL